MTLRKNSSKRSTPVTCDIVCDTNILYSAILFDGPENVLVDQAVVEGYRIIVSEYILDELSGVFRRKGLPLHLLREVMHHRSIVVLAEKEIEQHPRFEEFLCESKRLITDIKDRPIYVLTRIWQTRQTSTYLVSGDALFHQIPVKKNLGGRVKNTREMLKILLKKEG